MSIVFFYNLEKHGVYNLGGRLLLRPIEPEDGAIVAYWRNSPLARQSFFSRAVVTPDSHREWLAAKDSYDLVWMVEVAKGLERDTLVGMTALHITDGHQTAEYGRTFVDPRYHGHGYGTEIDYTTLAIAFEVFQLHGIWLDIYAENLRMIAIHRKTGWQDGEVRDTIYPGGRVMSMLYDRVTWAAHRAEAIALYGWDLPEWQP